MKEHPIFSMAFARTYPMCVLTLLTATIRR